MKIFTGQVTATKMKDTATVTVDRVIVHPVYMKRFKQTKKYQVHTEKAVAVGQKVRFVASKPYSKTKKWRLVEVVSEKEKVKKKGKK